MYTCAQHQANRIASLYGYKLAESVNLSEFKLGDGIIVLSKKGEPLMSGLIEKMYQSMSGERCVEVGGTPWNESQYMFRKM